MKADLEGFSKSKPTRVKLNYSHAKEAPCLDGSMSDWESRPVCLKCPPQSDQFTVGTSYRDFIKAKYFYYFLLAHKAGSDRNSGLLLRMRDVL